MDEGVEGDRVTTPYYEADGITLYLGSCLEILDWLTADVLITDPPYGIGGNFSSGARKRPGGIAPYVPHNRFGVQSWDDTVEIRDAALDLWGDRPYAVFGSPRRIDVAPGFRGAPLIWDKGPLIGMGDVAFPWRPNYEMIYVKGADWSGYRGESILRYPLDNRDAARIGHPTPKPVGLMAELVSKAPGTIVADPFAGSGSTLLAARQLGRPAIGVEVEERFAEVTANRLSQGLLFTS